ncbi:DUF1293 family protein [Vibrio cholerae]|uniref:DUF1293 family protein n=1 Tax=Vibrio cholerae TaxID=666 RepID=UPI00021A98F2|nr:DUF1293 family protein [Vibrio cholerae]EGQ8390387.1 DUF1293 domain-containing protein [Vibrio cholerae]EGQ8411726.1 DUF1293 domain-containing protein [Vibrio cholerae]EGR0143351.1 DUF1293 domain-containing protein [Vibrio cholerae]EGR0580917.1 DUF1293 domain-containing protein [Vibrio cholerae]EGR1449502.1 DUF1293 domain-containing protein [Vibrio cholerae]
MARSRVFVLGINFVWNQMQGDHAILNLSRPLREVNAEKYKRRTLGECGEVNPQYDQYLHIDRKYAEKLEKSGAFVGRREYDVEVALNPLDPLAGSIVVDMVPVDPEVKKHFEASLSKVSA